MGYITYLSPSLFSYCRRCTLNLSIFFFSWEILDFSLCFSPGVKNYSSWRQVVRRLWELHSIQGGDEIGWDYLLFSHVNNGNLFCSYSAVSRGKEEEGIEVKEIQRGMFILWGCDKRALDRGNESNTALHRGAHGNALWMCIDQEECQKERVKYNKVGKIEWERGKKWIGCKLNIGCKLSRPLFREWRTEQNTHKKCL